MPSVVAGMARLRTKRVGLCSTVDSGSYQGIAFAMPTILQTRTPLEGQPYPRSKACFSSNCWKAAAISAWKRSFWSVRAGSAVA
jgi:hypothetical protein